MYDYEIDCTDCLFEYETGCTDCKICTYCGSHLYWSGDRSRLHFDHILPRSSGGRTVVPVCHHCNLSKGSKGLKSWLRYIRDNDSAYWDCIIEHNKWLQNSVAQVVREVRDE